MNQSGNKETRVIKASNMLQQKVGMGPIDEQTLQACQKVIDDNDVDFTPMASQYANELTASINEAKKAKDNSELHIKDVAEKIMQIKANATIFGYDLMGNLANVALIFVETIEELDHNAYEILDAYQKSLNLIIAQDLRGDGGDIGKELQKELQDACKRHLASRSSAPAT